MSKIWELTFDKLPPKFLGNPIAFVLWYVIGNSRDGPYGTGIDKRFDKIDFKTAFKWWFRNPIHNIMFYLLAIPYTNPKVLYGTPDKEEKPFWNKDGGLLIAITGGPFLSYRKNSFQFYIGWRPMKYDFGDGYAGILGLTIRKSN